MPTLFELPGGHALSRELAALLVMTTSATRPALELDWNELSALAVRTWTHPLVASLLSPADLATMPARARQVFELAPLAARVRWRAYERVMAPVMARWAEQGIVPLLLKGAALSSAPYPPSMRILNDLDLWVSPAQAELARATLLEHGFVSSPTSADAEKSRSGSVYTKVRGDRGDAFVVDLHVRAESLATTYVLASEEMARMATRGTFAGSPALIASPEWLLVHLAVQLGHDLHLTVQRSADVGALLRGPMNWETVVNVASHARASGALLLLLEWTSAAGQPAPPDVLARLAAMSTGTIAATRALLDARLCMPDMRLKSIVAHMLRLQLAQSHHLVLDVCLLVWRTARQQGIGAPRAALLAARSAPLVMGKRVVLALLKPRSEQRVLRGLLWRSLVRRARNPGVKKATAGVSVALRE